jgi:hypothetical protein
VVAIQCDEYMKTPKAGEIEGKTLKKKRERNRRRQGENACAWRIGVLV